ncbi:hypothetical protein [Alkaliphilus metalliredigens]|uniref:hypothetical protein n=1 Tax=Alkaliphilus metalliredigens TaxID=208226 RepID=UPI0012EED30D|nr:hypothetical protein [Alkaliphilus metalliredigens]
MGICGWGMIGLMGIMIFSPMESTVKSKETYPLIIFRDITYFPLTWRFAVDEFRWDYSFSGESGLKIESFTPSPKNHVYPIITEKLL